MHKLKSTIGYINKTEKQVFQTLKREHHLGEKGEMNAQTIGLILIQTYSDIRTNSESDYISIFGHQDIFKVLEVLIKYNSYKAELMFAL